MNYLSRTLNMASNALRRNVMRSALTTLGIVIGVAAVIAMVEIGQGSKKAVAQTIQSMGANTLLIMPGTAASGGVSFGSGSILTLTPADADALRRYCWPRITHVAPIVRARTQVVYGNKNWVPVFIYGTTPEFLDVREWDLADGRAFTDQEVAGAADVCVLGQTLVRELFGDESPLDRVVRVNNEPLRVVGVLSVKGANMMGVDQDDIVLAPWRTIKYKVSGQSAQTANQSAAAIVNPSMQVITSSQRYPTGQLPLYPVQSPSQLLDVPLPLLPTNIDQILVKVASENEIKAAMQEAQVILRERHHRRPGQPDDFSIRDMTEISKALGSTSKLMGALLLCVAMISLMVGGVGIMNIMLVSVTERTKEIGLRMAVGARAGDILRQFLTEAVLLCLLGGAIGIVLGRTGSFAVSFFLHWPTEVSLPAIVASVAVSAAVGVMFGYYPAWKASRLDPIEALRYE